MRRALLSILPLPVLAVLVVASACSRPRSDEPATRVIPPAARVLAPAPAAVAAAAAPAPPPAAEPARAPRAAEKGEDAPTPEDVKEFQRPVPK